MNNNYNNCDIPQN